jgi:hypothetical protein
MCGDVEPAPGGQYASAVSQNVCAAWPAFWSPAHAARARAGLAFLPAAATCSFPMATSAAFLAWGVLEFKEAYTSAGELQHAQDSLRWVADYL